MDESMKIFFATQKVSIRLKEVGFPQSPSLGYCYDPLATVPDHLFKYADEVSCSTDERMGRMVTAPMYEQVFHWASVVHDIHTGYYYCTDEEIAKSDVIKTNHLFAIKALGKKSVKMTLFAEDKYAGFEVAALAIIQLIETLR